ncbi:MAG: hypothetical protein AAFV38_08970 [Pseudomonadota bacterium]
MALCTTATAHPLNDPRTELFVAVIVQAGCEMTDSVADVELPKYGFTKAETRDIVGDLLLAGQAVLDRTNGLLMLKTRECAE